MTIVHSHHILSSWKAVKGREVFIPLRLWNISLVDYVCSLHARLTEVLHDCCKPFEGTD